MGKLYIVATPIGNLEDVTLRALRGLGEVSFIAAEDTRTVRVLLRRHNIRKKVISYNEHNMARRTAVVLDALSSGDVALVSEAGTPGVSDPGHELIRAAIDAGREVVPVPGASALLAALVASGMPMRQVRFLGFAPRRPAERRRLFTSLLSDPATIVVFESPHRIVSTLKVLQGVLGERHIAVCREMTKLHEEVFRGKPEDAVARVAEPRGEFTLVIEGATSVASAPDDEVLGRALLAYRDSGTSLKAAVAAVVKDTGAPRKRVYSLALGVYGEGG
jgi:16S rRNA (cytidine1402-2'-O)-methyltransferase